MLFSNVGLYLLAVWVICLVLIGLVSLMYSVVRVVLVVCWFGLFDIRFVMTACTLIFVCFCSGFCLCDLVIVLLLFLFC